MKTEVYSWRVSPEMKADLEAEARRQKISLSALLDKIAGDWLRKHRKRILDEEAEVARIRAAMEKCIGSIAMGGGPYTNEKVRAVIGEQLARKHARNRPR
jgi:hypothetical protein